MHPSSRGLVLLALLSACDAQPEPQTTPDDDAAPFASLIDRGLADMMGTITPTSSDEDDKGVVSHTFDPLDGAVCIYGEPFRAMTREGSRSDLLIFLQGGGACWSELCLAIDVAPPGIPKLDVLDAEDPNNPVADWNVLYVPYCDGSLFIADASFDDDDDGDIDRYQHGLANFSAALDLALSEFPTPERVLFAGSSGGGYGTLLTTPLVRHAFPDAELMVLNDAGVGIAKRGDPSFIGGLIEEFGVSHLLPMDECPSCFEEGHITQIAGWQMDQDPDLSIGMFSSYRDFVISSMFLRIEPARFESALLEQTERLASRHPDRFARFLVEGIQHTSLVGDLEGVLGEDAEALREFESVIQLGGMHTTELDGVTVADWMRAMLDDRAAWTSHVP